MFEILMAWQQKSTSRHFEVRTTWSPTNITVILTQYETTYRRSWLLMPAQGPSGTVIYDHDFNIREVNEAIRIMDAILNRNLSADYVHPPGGSAEALRLSKLPGYPEEVGPDGIPHDTPIILEPAP